ncbi:MAG: sensor histidine kinase [Planctomycetes bacterium]|nr:sensor histidine kinase [Planctomycetota bacterium]
MPHESALDAVTALVDLLVRSPEAVLRDRLVLETGLAAAEAEAGAVWRRSPGMPWRPSVERGRRGGRFESERATRRVLESQLAPHLPGTAIVRAEVGETGIALILAGQLAEPALDALEALLTGLALVELSAGVAPGPEAPLPARGPAARLEHDVRNALASLSATRQLLERFGADLPAADRNRFCEAVERECERTGALLARGLIGGAVADRSGAAGEVTADVLELERAAVESAGGTVRWQVAPEAHALRPALGAAGWSRVLRNLVVNAREAAVARGLPVRIRVELGVEAADPVLHLTVEDASGGLPPGPLAHLFEDGFRADKPGGSGQGLAVVRELVLASGGALAAARRWDGARFELWVPAIPSLRAAPIGT